MGVIRGKMDFVALFKEYGAVGALVGLLIYIIINSEFTLKFPRNKDNKQNNHQN